MGESIFRQPTTEQLTAFALGDPIAKDEIAHLLLPQLARWAWLHYANLPKDEVQSIVNGVLAEILRAPERYDPDLASFTTYAIHVIKFRLNSLYQVLRKIKEFHDASEAARENLPQLMYNQIDSVEIHYQIERDQFFSEAMKRLVGAEKDFLKLMLEGEKQIEVFAQALAQYGAITNPAREVKNTKAVMLRKLQTLARDLGYEADDLMGS
jgi:DNA-directed RNA polymerase specialized sigma subunit